MSIKYVVTESPLEETAKGVEEMLSNNQSKPILFLISGGSAFKVLDHLSPDVFGPHVTITLLDERCHQDASNYSELTAMDYYGKVIDKGVTDMFKVNDLHFFNDCASISKSWENALREWRNENKNGVVLALMGIGSDGHIAGILPLVSDDMQQFEDESWVVSYEAPPEVNPYPKRITPTFTFFRSQVAEAVVYATGESKQEAIDNIFKPEGSVTKTPSRLLLELPTVTLYSDLPRNNEHV